MTSRQSRANPVDVAYLAGIFDGEGNFSVARVNGTDEHYQCHTKFSNSSMPLLLRCQQTIMQIAGKRYSIKQNSVNKFTRHICYRIEVCDQQGILRLCEAMIPHLHAKREQAEEMLAWILSRKENRHKREGYTEYERGIISRLSTARELHLIKSPEGVENKPLAPSDGAS